MDRADVSSWIQRVPGQWLAGIADRLPLLLGLRALGIYLFAVIISYLAAAYLGTFFVVFASAIILLPVLSFLLLLLASFGLRYRQHFSNEHPVKGQVIAYRCVIQNTSFIPLPRVRALFRAIRPTDADHPGIGVRGSRDRGHQQVLETFLPGNEEVAREQTVQLPYRGIYNIGLDRIELGDTLQLFTIRPRVRRRAFRVYPRILQLRSFRPGTERRFGTSEEGSLGALPDYALFNQLREYRPGESVRHLAWKKFASTGIPVVKDYDSTSEPAVTIYVDLRPMPPHTEDVLLAEDVTVEALVALVNHFLERNLPVIVRAASRELFDFSGDHSSDFKRFYESTFALLFESDISAARLYQSHLETGMNTEVNSMFFITHLLDPEILLLLEEQRANNFQLTLIYNQTAEAAGGVPGAGSPWPAAGADRQTLAYSGYFNRLREQGTRVVTLRGAESIVADLEANYDDQA